MVEWSGPLPYEEVTEMPLGKAIKNYVSLFTEMDAENLDYDQSLRLTYEKKLENAVESGLLTPEQYRKLVLPLAVHQANVFDPAVWLMCWVVEYALMHPNCPTDVLTAVCRSAVPRRAYQKPFMFPVWQYREVAAMNPNCPEEDRVYAALLDGKSS